MAVDIKLFAPVARATNAIYMYVKLDEAKAAITAAIEMLKGNRYDQFGRFL